MNSSPAWQQSGLTTSVCQGSPSSPSHTACHLHHVSLGPGIWVTESTCPFVRSAAVRELQCFPQTWPTQVLAPPRRTRRWRHVTCSVCCLHAAPSRPGDQAVLFGRLTATPSTQHPAICTRKPLTVFDCPVLPSHSSHTRYLLRIHTATQLLRKHGTP